MDELANNKLRPFWAQVQLDLKKKVIEKWGKKDSILLKVGSNIGDAFIGSTLACLVAEKFGSVRFLLYFGRFIA